MTESWGTMADAAHHLGVSVRTISRRIDEGKIRAKKFGTIVRVDMAALSGAGDTIGGAA